MNYLKLEVENRLAIVSFCRERAYNAINREVLCELDRLLDELASNPVIDVVIFTGVGRAFIAGADIAEMASMREADAMTYAQLGISVFNKLEQLPQVTIAAINGFCLGGGNELALACDVRLSSTKAKFGQPEVSLGITPGFLGTQRLPRLIGVGHTKDLLFTGRTIDANEALRIGLVNAVYEEEDFLHQCKAYAQLILKNSTMAVQSVKCAINEGINVEMTEAVMIENHYFARCFEHVDQKEGMNAFLEKRPAQFKKEEYE